MTEPTEQAAHQKPFDERLPEMVRSLISELLKESQERGHGETPLDKTLWFLKHQAGENTLDAITALSSYMHARSAERQAAALEGLARTASKLQIADSTDAPGQAIIDQREPKREYLASTYSLAPAVLTFLWAFRGMLMDASLKSLSRPERFEQFRRVSTEEVAWSLRITADDVLSLLPRTNGSIDYELLEDFGIYHYGGTETEPDDWMYGG